MQTVILHDVFVYAVNRMQIGRMRVSDSVFRTLASCIKNVWSSLTCFQHSYNIISTYYCDHLMLDMICKLACFTPLIFRVLSASPCYFTLP
jgi:hypothetical protein